MRAWNYGAVFTVEGDRVVPVPSSPVTTGAAAVRVVGSKIKLVRPIAKLALATAQLTSMKTLAPSFFVNTIGVDRVYSLHSFPVRDVESENLRFLPSEPLVCEYVLISM